MSTPDRRSSRRPFPWPELALAARHVAVAGALVASLGLTGRTPAIVLAAPADTTRGPVLFVPARPDSTTDDSEPAPFLVPGSPVSDSLAGGSAKARAREQYRLGLTLERNRAQGPAFVAYQNAVRLDPDIRDAHHRAGLLLAATGHFVDAVRELSAEVERHPDHTDAARALGVNLIRAGQNERAIEQLELLTRRDREDGASWHALGFAYLSDGRATDAVTALRRAIALPPTDAEEHRDLGAALAALGREAEARGAYSQALVLAPHDPSIWVNLGNMERRAGRPDSALARYRQAESRDSSFSIAYRAQADVLLERGQKDRALEVYRRWLASLPDEHATRLEAITLYNELGARDSALAVAHEGVRRATDEGQARMILGMTLAGHGRTREALVELRRAEAGIERRRADPARVRGLIAALRAQAPDSLRSLFEADSLAHPPRSSRGRP